MRFHFREGLTCRCSYVDFYIGTYPIYAQKVCEIHQIKQNCDNYPCKRGFFPCGVKNTREDTCVRNEVRCNSKNDCGNWADEKTKYKKDCKITDRGGGKSLPAINNSTRFLKTVRGKVYFI